MSKFDPDQRKRLVSDHVNKMKFVKDAQSKNDFDRLFDHLNNIVADVQELIKPILKAGGGFDKPALRVMVFAAFLEKFGKLDKQELEAIVTSIFADRIMADVDSNPRGNDKPDLLGGK